MPACVSSAVNRQRTRNSTSCVCKISLLQEKSTEWALIRSSSPVWRHTPLRTCLRSRPCSPQETHRAAWHCSVQPSPPAALSRCTPFLPTPAAPGTPIAACDTVADRHGGRNMPSAHRRRRSCQRRCRQPCSAGPKLCGPRRRDRAEVSEDAECPQRKETRRHVCTLLAQSWTVASSHTRKRNATGCVLSW